MAQPPLVLVDGSAYLYRAFMALPPLTNSRGEPTGAVYGVANMLRKLIAQYQPTHMAAVFDAPGPTFRNDLYPEYKANRPPAPDELRAQVEPLFRLVEALGIALVCHEGVEADDVIATLARQFASPQQAVVISTSDKDLAQLVTPTITLLNTMTDTHLDEAGVMAKFGVPPALIVDYLTLIGDKSDNIPGVPGVGAKTAAKWLLQYGSLDGLMAELTSIKGKVGERLREHSPQLALYRSLVQIKDDVPLGLSLEDLRYRGGDKAALAAQYQQLEFNSWRQQLDADPALAPASAAASAGAFAAEEIAPPAPAVEYELVTDWEGLKRWLERLQRAELIAFDTETNSLDYLSAELVGVSLAVEPYRAAYIPVGHDYPGAPAQLDRAEVLAALKPLLEDPACPKVGQHLKFDAHILASCGIELRGIAHDTMLASYVLNSTASRHDMDSLAKRYLNVATVSFESIAGKGVKQLTFNQIDLATAAHYAAEDADITLRLHQALQPRLLQAPALERLYRELEIPLVPVLQRMERIGVRIDPAPLKSQSEAITQRLFELERQIHEAAGSPFNVGSTKQLQEILFDRLQLPVRRKTPKGQPSTAEEVLQELAQEHPLPQLILDYRELAKLKSTYVDRLPQQINPHTGRVHTSYHQAVTSTGRLSSSDPNLQNIPVRSESGRQIRQAFVASPGYRLVAADYSQIELRIMAHLAQDPGFLEAFAHGEDIHRRTAMEVFGLAEVTPQQRRFAKTINFGLIYGMSAFGLARRLGIAHPEAQRYVERYFERYPGVKRYMSEVVEQAAQQGYVETLFGRRIHLEEINARQAGRRQGAERLAINAPMQGTAADVIKRAMIAIDSWLMAGEIDAKMVMQVHDELVFEVAEEAVEPFSAQVRGLMQRADGGLLSVPLEVDIGVGDNWDEAH